MNLVKKSTDDNLNRNKEKDLLIYLLKEEKFINAN